MPPDQQLPLFVNDANIDLGYRYRSTAVVQDADDWLLHANPRQSRGLPGTRAPHVVLARDGHEISTHDLLGQSFVLLAGPDAETLTEAARHAATRLGVAVDVHRLSHAPTTDWFRAATVRSPAAGGH